MVSALIPVLSDRKNTGTTGESSRPWSVMMRQFPQPAMRAGPPGGRPPGTSSQLVSGAAPSGRPNRVDISRCQRLFTSVAATFACATSRSSRLGVADQQAVVAQEQRVVAPAGLGERAQQLRPDRRVPPPVLLQVGRINVSEQAVAGHQPGSPPSRPPLSGCTRITSRVRGPWTPSTRLSSMSLVALGPLIMVIGRVGSSRAIACGHVGHDLVGEHHAEVVVGDQA